MTVEDKCPHCPHQTFVHALSGGCSAKDCFCSADSRGVRHVVGEPAVWEPGKVYLVGSTPQCKRVWEALDVFEAERTPAELNRAIATLRELIVVPPKERRA